MEKEFTSLQNRALGILPGGVNSPVRAFKQVGGQPLFTTSAKGPYLFTENNTRYIDYLCGYGPIILGHQDLGLQEILINRLHKGYPLGTPTQWEIQLAEKIANLMPSIHSLRFVNSGTEATMTALRLARGFTNREKIVKFEGGYHGHSDSLLVKAGSGGLTFGQPNSKGILKDLAAHTLVAPFNDINALKTLFKAHGKNIACIIVEPIAGNMNFITPQPGFLQSLRTLCDEYNSLLIFDEIMSGFRVTLGGAQNLYQITPDLTCLGKIIGGGFPIGAVGGDADIMALLAPNGPVYQAGTFSGHPLIMEAGLYVLTQLEKPQFYETLHQKMAYLIHGLMERAQKRGIPFLAHGMGGLFGLYFTNKKQIHALSDLDTHHVKQFKRFFQAMLKQHIHLPPSAFESSFLTQAHTKKELDETIVAAEKAFENL